MAEARHPTSAPLDALLRAARERLVASRRATTPDLDTRLLAEEAFGMGPTELRMGAAKAVSAAEAERFAALIERRAAGEPVHRILGRRAFYDHEFALSPETLEPRPDTEALVDLAAQALRESGCDAPVFADLGTGSGAIAVSLLALFPRACCVAVDLSPSALATARRNAEAAGVADRFWPLAADFLAPIASGLDLVVSNPPYIPTRIWADLEIEVRDHDPRLALDGGLDGLDAYRSIAAGLKGFGQAPRDILLEIGAGQADDVGSIMEAAGARLHAGRDDLGGHLRALWFRFEADREQAAQKPR